MASRGFPVRPGKAQPSRFVWRLRHKGAPRLATGNAADPIKREMRLREETRRRECTDHLLDRPLVTGPSAGGALTARRCASATPRRRQWALPRRSGADDRSSLGLVPRTLRNCKDQFFHVEWLWKISAHAESSLRRVGGACTRNDDDWNHLSTCQGPITARKFPSVQARKSQVENHDVWPTLAQALQGFHAVPRRQHLVAPRSMQLR